VVVVVMARSGLSLRQEHNHLVDRQDQIIKLFVHLARLKQQRSHDIEAKERWGRLADIQKNLHHSKKENNATTSVKQSNVEKSHGNEEKQGKEKVRLSSSKMIPDD
jgi:beta-xylosidase